jgi:hypothetical protein
MRTCLHKLALFVLPLAVLAGSACSGHHRSHHYDGGNEGTYNRGSYEERYDARGPSNDENQQNESRYGRSDLRSWRLW